MRMNYVKHSRNHADSEYMYHVWVDPEGAEFISNKHTNSRLPFISTDSYDHITCNR